MQQELRVGIVAGRRCGTNRRRYRDLLEVTKKLGLYELTTDDTALHGGTWIRIDAGFAEISVFEKGVPPHFRLYFFDAAKRPRPAVANTTISVETIRPDGARQVFAFIPEAGYLRSTSDIPEPHEFQVRLALPQADDSRTYETTFTEEGHGHSHSPGGHAHDHGGGIIG